MMSHLLRTMSVALKNSIGLPTESSLAVFLRNSKESYLGNENKDWTLVMGNEAGDLDSIASSIAYAYTQSIVHNKPTVSLVRFDSNDLALRAENTQALQLAGILNPRQDLLFMDDLPAVLPSEIFALVDHNRLASQFNSSNAVVTAIVDHHADEHFHTGTETDPRIVVAAGSCSSHITALVASDVNADIPPELSTLLLCAILIDTNGLKAGGKALDVDRKAADWLVPRSTLAVDASYSLLPSSSQVADLSASLSSSKNDVSHLSLQSLLKRDYKEYYQGGTRSGLSSVPIRISELDSWQVPNETASSPDFCSEVLRYMESRDLSILGVLTSFRHASKTEGKKGKGRREMAWFVRGSSTVDADQLSNDLWSGLEASKELDVSVKKKYTDKFNQGDIRAKVYEQEPDATRKVTAPVLQAILEGRTKNANF